MKLNRYDLNNCVIDVHTHCGGIHFTHYFHEIFPYCCNVQELVLNMDRVGIDYSVTFPIPTNICTDNLPIINKQVADAVTAHEPCLYYWANRRLVMEARLFGHGRILPFVIFSLYGDYNRQISHFKELISNYDIYGIKIHPSSDQTSIVKLIEDDTLRRFIQEAQLPVLIHSGLDPYSDSSTMCEIFEEFKTVRFCVAHAGRMNKAFVSKLNAYNNVWIDISPIYILPASLANCDNPHIIKLDYDNPNSILNYFLQNNPNKVLFGTDYPWVVCGALDKCKDITYEDNYKKSVELLMTMSKENSQRVANKNICNYLFGDE